MPEKALTPEAPFRDLLRRLPVFDTDLLPDFDPGLAPADPVIQFTQWFAAAVEGGVPEPHAMSLATAGADGRPSSRVLICKDVEPGGRWFFASSSTSPKGRDLAAQPHAALGFYWPQQGRQIRIRGEVTPASAERSAADFLARTPGARAEALAGRQSDVLADAVDQQAVIADTQERIAADPHVVAPTWTLYGLLADEVEFWQFDRDRQHIRLRYRRNDRDWIRERLWP
jgi:pyridoxamine 5'-phosphate oxidase